MGKFLQVLVALSAFVSIVPGIALGQQSLNDVERRERDRAVDIERQNRLEEPKVTLPEDVVIPAEPDAPIGADQPCFDIHTVRLVIPASVPLAKGNSPEKLIKRHFSFLEDVTDRYQGRCIGQGTIGRLLNELMAAVISQGYTTTRFYLSQQDMRSGTLSINLIPGFVDNIIIRGDGGRLIPTFTFPVSQGDVLNLRELEQGLEQVKRLASFDVTMQLVPSLDKLARSDVMLTLERQKPWHVNISVDDAGVDSTGKHIARVGALLDNPLRIADQLALNTFSDLDSTTDVDTRGGDVSYTVPYGYWTHQASAGISEYRQLFGFRGDLVSSGETQSVSVKSTRVIYRNKKQKIELYAKVANRSARAYLNDLEILVQRSSRSSLEAGYRQRTYFGQASLDIVLASRWGVPWFRADDDPAGQTSSDATRRYSLQTLDISYSRPLSLFGKPISYLGTVRAQYTNDILFGSEFFAIGDRYSVRGFGDEDTLSADKGAYLRNQLSARSALCRCTGIVGLDAGTLSGPATDENVGNSLVGAYVGARGALYRANYDFFVGLPVYQPKDFDVSGANFGFSVSTYF